MRRKISRLVLLRKKSRQETAAREDLNQQYESLVSGMKDFEKTMAELNQENVKISGEYDALKEQLDKEKKRAKDFEHTLSVKAKNNLLEKLARLNSLGKGLDIASIVDSKLVYKENRVTVSGFADAVEGALSLALEMSNKRFNSQLEEER